MIALLGYRNQVGPSLSKQSLPHIANTKKTLKSCGSWRISAELGGPQTSRKPLSDGAFTDFNGPGRITRKTITIHLTFREDFDTGR